MRGGQIDARITLALRLPSRQEGGAVVDAEGRLIGMAVTGVGRRAIAIPASTIERAVKILSEKGYIPRGYLGVTLHPLEGKGAIVVGVAEDSPGAKSRVGNRRCDHHMGWHGGRGRTRSSQPGGRVGSRTIGKSRSASGWKRYRSSSRHRRAAAHLSFRRNQSFGVAFELDDAALEQTLRALLPARPELYEAEDGSAAVIVTDRTSPAAISRRGRRWCGSAPIAARRDRW